MPAWLSWVPTVLKQYEALSATTSCMEQRSRVVWVLARRISGLIEKVISPVALPMFTSTAAVSGAAKRIMAAECSAFLIDTDLKSEKWSPYMQSARELDANHTIITFDYDLVLDRLAKECATLAVEH